MRGSVRPRNQLGGPVSACADIFSKYARTTLTKSTSASRFSTTARPGAVCAASSAIDRRIGSSHPDTSGASPRRWIIGGNTVTSGSGARSSSKKPPISEVVGPFPFSAFSRPRSSIGWRATNCSSGIAEARALETSAWAEPPGKTTRSPDPRQTPDAAPSSVISHRPRVTT